MVSTFIVALAVLCALGRDARADDTIGRLPFRHYGSDDGLAITNLSMGAQDGAGFTWAAGSAGLVRYDGLRFRRYGLEDGLPALLVTDIAVAPDGALWGATSRGAFYESKGQLVAFGTAVLPENGTHQVAFDPQGRYWVTTTVGPFVRDVSGKLELVPVWPGGDSFGIAFEPDGSLLVGQSARLLRRAVGHSEFRDVGHDFGGTITAIVRDGTGRLWLRAGARLWSQRNAEAPFEDRTADYLGALPGPYPRRLALSAEKRLLIPTTIGLITVDERGARFVKTELPADAMSLRACWVDREGSLWLAGLGLHRETGRGLWRTASIFDGLPSNPVWGVLRASNGSLIVATETGAAKSVGGRLERLPGIEMAGYVSEGPAGTLWFAGDGRVTRFDLATNRSHPFGAEAGLPPVPVMSSVADRRGSLWVAFDSAGVYRARLDSLVTVADHPAPRFERVTLPNGAASDRVTKIFDDGERVWLATSHGLNVETEHGWRELTTNDGLRSNAPTLITRHGSELCIAYAGRSDLSCFTHAGGAISNLRHLEVPGKLVPELIGEDARHRLWIGTTQGVTVLDGERVDQFPRADGAPGDDTSFDTFLAEADGTVWIGTSSGLGRFEGARYPGPPSAPPVTFVSGELAGAALDPTTPPHEAVPYESVLAVRFSALSSIDERHIEHEVRLFGYDDEWHRADTREVQYQKLPGGSYRFAVRARRPSVPWGQPTSFEFGVQFAFWQLWWFRALVAIAALLGIARITRGRARALEKRNLKLEQTVQERTSDLNKQHAGARRILDAVDQGLFSVAADGTIEPEIFASARSWFGAPASGQHVWEWLPSDDGIVNRSLKVGWDTYRDGFMPQEVVFDQLPQRLCSSGRTYALRWLPNETTDGALVVATDITDTLEVERAERARQETMESLRKLHEDRSGYLEFLGEAERLLDGVSDTGNEPERDARLLHTLKGNSAIFALGSFSARCHDLETAMHERGRPLAPEERTALRQQWTETIRHLRPFLHLGLEESINISRSELAAVLAALANGATSADLEQRITRWRLEPTRPRLERIGNQARRLAQVLGKGAIDVTTQDHDVRLARAAWTPFWTSLVHVVRNAVDHGIEPAVERCAAGKPAEGRLTLETRIENRELVIAIRDDGRGIDWTKVASAARAHDLPHATREELVAALFADGISTSDKVTTTSGRGVGMAAAREAATALGGYVVVHSEAGRGTCIEFRFAADAGAAVRARAA
ncbi:hypothetical protein BH11MYX4_BH11MYX4_04890 [soil metagenome]